MNGPERLRDWANPDYEPASEDRGPRFAVPGDFLLDCADAWDKDRAEIERLKEGLRGQLEITPSFGCWMPGTDCCGICASCEAKDALREPNDGGRSNERHDS